MTKEEARNLMMDYLFDELDEAHRHEFEAYISKHADLKQELEELTGTRELLQHLPVESPAEKLTFLEPETESLSSESIWSRVSSLLIPQNVFAKGAFGIATFVFLFFVMGAFTDMNISVGDEGFSMTFGEQPPVQTGYTAAQVEMLITQVQQENAELIEDYVLAAQEQQELQFQQTLATFAEYMDEQRENDLELMNYSLTSLEENTYTRFQQTDQVLGEIIQTVSTN